MPNKTLIAAFSTWQSSLANKQAFVGYQQPEKKKKQQGSIMPTLAGGLAGVGALSAGTAYGLGSDKHFDTLRQSLDQAHIPLKPHETALTRYENLMSRGAQTTPFGQPAGNILARARANDQVMDWAGIQSHRAKTPGLYQEAKAHYDQFRKGPMPAYFHQIKAKGKEIPVSPGLATDTAKTYDQLMLPKFNKAYEDWREQQKGTGGLLEGASWLEPHELETSAVPHETQLDFMKQFHEGLSPEMQAERQRVETDVWGPGLKGNKARYEPIMQQGLDTRDMLKTLGTTAGGAGVGGLLGHYLHKGIAGQDEDEEGTDMSNVLATLAGAGAGGAAGYYAMPKDVRNRGVGQARSLLTKGKNKGIALSKQFYDRLGQMAARARG